MCTKLIFLHDLEEKKGGKSQGLYLCSCGNKKPIVKTLVNRGKLKSCGCMKNTQNGFYNKALYPTYKGIMLRCNNFNMKNYKNYGGRGIKCEWNSFEEFYRDMGDRPGKGYSIDRINNNGNYCKENCRWVDSKTQNNNKRNSINYNGKTLGEWCIYLGVSKSTIRNRVINKGISYGEVIDEMILTM